MKKIAIIVQRYGHQINGGAEFHAKILAEKLSKKYLIEVLTTKAIDSNSWANEIDSDQEIVDGIPVKRFPTLPKNQKKFRKARRKILATTPLQKFLKKINLYNFLKRNLNLFTITEKDCLDWLEHQGPYTPYLINHIKANKNNYDGFIFFTYLYYPTVLGLKEVGYKSILIPTAHDEPLLYTKAYEKLFSSPKYLMFNTKSEQKLVLENFKQTTDNYDIAGIGIDKIYSDQAPSISQEKYLLYIGRIEADKGCLALIEYFNKSSFKKPLKLIFIGKNNLNIESSENIIFKGFVDEKTKYTLLDNCVALVMPSKYESLSLVTLEAMLHKKITVVNHHCEVLKDHIIQSEAGFTYKNQTDFENTINNILLLNPAAKEELSQKGYNYVKENYSWEKVISKFEKALSIITA